MKLKFLGAAGTVTGSRYLLESHKGHRILIDCGLFQGLKNLRLRNWESFPVAPNSIEAIVLTHAHIDHSGYIPKIVKEGFSGEIHASHATKALAEILLEDSAHIKEEEAEYANRKKFSKHDPALALYTKQDVVRALPLFRAHGYQQEFWIGDFKIKFIPAGHILGACSVLVECEGKKILFSGDLGRDNDLLMKAPHKPPACDYLIMESTYGDRLHDAVDPIEALDEILEEALKNKSVLMIPSFAVGRAQLLLYCIYKVFEKYPHLKMPVFVNSPMASEVTDLYQRFLEDHKLDEAMCRHVCNSARFVQSIEESKALNRMDGPMIIIAASGMLTGGRILHHLEAFGADPKNMILMVGFQAQGTRGARLIRGERSIKFHGYYHDINAKLIELEFFSAHADQQELIKWLQSMPTKPRKIFLTHGEPEAAALLKQKLVELDYLVSVPEDLDEVEI